MAEKQHYVPATLIGGFGSPDKSGRPRDAHVAIRWKGKPEEPPQDVAASYIGWVRELYRFAEPAEFDPDILDKAWLKLEGDLTPVVSRLTMKTQIPSDHEWVIAYLAAVGVRHPTFGDHARRVRASMGDTEPVGDDVQRERIRTLLGSVELLSTDWRFRILHRAANARRFVLSDLAWCNIAIGNRVVHLFPLNGDCAIALYSRSQPESQNHRHGINAHFTLLASAVDVINATTWWLPEVSWVAGHPDDREYLSRLEELQAAMWPTHGPLMGRSGELFD